MTDIKVLTMLCPQGEIEILEPNQGLSLEQAVLILASCT